MKILLVEPESPVPAKSKNHKDFLPVGLLKIGSHFTRRRDVERVELVRGKKGISFTPDRIFVTSLFTYWSEYFWETVEFYRRRFPKASVQVGGIYVSLFYDNPDFKKRCRRLRLKRWRGILKYAEEKNEQDYSLLPSNPQIPDFQIIHASRGCVRRCDFCGTWRIEPKFEPKQSIGKEIRSRKLVFYDNNFLANPHIEDILRELIELKKGGKILWCESQSGFDGRMLMENPSLGRMIKKAGFRYPRIAWDWGYKEHSKIKRQVDTLVGAGYSTKNISIFMLYNWELPFKEMEKKRVKCWDWQVQVADCRYRPLDQTFDRYNPRKSNQTDADYHIHTNSGWTDALVRQFRRNVRRHNICVRHGFPFYSKAFEHKRVSKSLMRATKKMRTGDEKERFLQEKGIDYWIPDRITYPEDYGSRSGRESQPGGHLLKHIVRSPA